MSRLNSKTLMIAAAVLVVLALLFMASPLLRVSGFTNRTGTNRQFDGQFPSNGQNSFPRQNNGTQGQNPTDQNGLPQFPQGQNDQSGSGQQFTRQGGGLFAFAFLGGMTGIIVYALALLVALAAAAGMFFTKRWGQILGIIMGVFYLILALVSFLPMILLGFARAINGLNLGLSIVHIVLALAVIILALIPARKLATTSAPAAPITPPASDS